MMAFFLYVLHGVSGIALGGAWRSVLRMKKQFFVVIVVVIVGIVAVVVSNTFLRWMSSC